MRSKLIDVLVVAVLLLAVIAIPSHTDNMRQVINMAEKPIIVIDPGHGGIDGGAQAVDGTCEKNINLSIGLMLRDMLNKEGISVVMTREEDEGLHEKSLDGTIRTLKTADMHERKAIIDGAGADLVVSIHLNSFSEDVSVKGAQVFFPKEGDERVLADSAEAAKIIQNGLNNNVNFEKKRTELSKEDIFIFKDANEPIVIVECGFLSNEEDLRNLKNGNYQEKISKSLKGSICKYLRGNGNNIQ